MKKNAALGLVAATMMAIAPVAPASAHDSWHHGGGGDWHHGGGWHHEGPVLGLLGLGAAAVVGTLALATAPFNSPFYDRQPSYAPAYAPAYYAPRAYYAPPPQPVYYAPAPVYYSEPPVYYYGR
jgi:hypothetical protein